MELSIENRRIKINFKNHENTVPTSSIFMRHVVSTLNFVSLSHNEGLLDSFPGDMLSPVCQCSASKGRAPEQGEVL